MDKPTIKEMHKVQRNLCTQLHEIRVSKQLSLDDVYHATKIPTYLIDSQEIGGYNINLSIIFQLARFYGKRVEINLVEPEEKAKC